MYIICRRTHEYASVHYVNHLHECSIRMVSEGYWRVATLSKYTIATSLHLVFLLLLQAAS